MAKDLWADCSATFLDLRNMVHHFTLNALIGQNPVKIKLNFQKWISQWQSNLSATLYLTAI